MAGGLQLPLVSEKVATLVETLRSRRAAAAAAGTPWACMVFVQTRLMARILENLVGSLPGLRGSSTGAPREGSWRGEGGDLESGPAGLVARAFLGHNESGGSSELLMSMAVSCAAPGRRQPLASVRVCMTDAVTSS